MLKTMLKMLKSLEKMAVFRNVLYIKNVKAEIHVVQLNIILTQ